MASSRLLMASIAVVLVIYGVGADSEIEDLRSRIFALESSISDRIQDIKKKDQSISNFENVIKDKSASIFSFQRERELLRKQAASDAEQSVEKVHAQASEMEKQVARLKRDIEAKVTERGALEARCAEAEKKTQELNLKLLSLQDNFDKQKLRIKRTERVLQVAEVGYISQAYLLADFCIMLSHLICIESQEELMNAQLDTASKLNKFTEVFEAWFPLWLANHMSHCAEVAANHWNNHGKPAFDVFFQKVKVSVHENLKKHELTKPVATKELSWFLASAILGFPMFFLFRLLSAILCKKITCSRSTNRDKPSNNHKRKHGVK